MADTSTPRRDSTLVLDRAPAHPDGARVTVYAPTGVEHDAEVERMAERYRQWLADTGREGTTVVAEPGAEPAAPAGEETPRA